MNLAIAVAVFPVIFIGELPDKTMFASLVLSTRGRPLRVWLGAAGAFAVHVVIAVSVGAALLRILPHRAVEAVVALMFLAAALLAVREAVRERRGEGASHAEVRHTGQPGRTVLTAFVVVFLAEWGDLTQILTANLAARYNAPLSVGVGAAAALWAVAALAVMSGASLLRWVNIAAVRLVTAVILTGLAAVTGWLALRLSVRGYPPGGPWLRRMRPSGLVAVVVPSALRVMTQPHRWIMIR
jgi:putative Ca2+/H+ antiporter (TMEM165/GDT1 family)